MRMRRFSSTLAVALALTAMTTVVAQDPLHFVTMRSWLGGPR